MNGTKHQDPGTLDALSPSDRPVMSSVQAALETSLQPAISPASSQNGVYVAELFPRPAHCWPISSFPMILGRDTEHDIFLDDPSVSRSHARLEQGEQGLVLVDLQSKNGCFVNRMPVKGPAPVPVGAVIRLGSVVLYLGQRPLDASEADLAQDPNSPLVGGASLMQVRRSIQLLAPTSLRILINGESGTGKELVARELHRLSERGGPFLAINCAALPEALVESELFGHERGAFTGASRDKAGLFEAARGGTLFLDEVTELPLASQAKLLRVVETGELRRVGAVSAVQTDCRIISATNRNVQSEIEQQHFRGDLAARLCEAPITLPPLRERIEDLPRLIGHLAQRARIRLKLSAEATEALACYHWPLNIRELDNLVRMLEVLAQGNLVEAEMLPGQVLSSPAGRPVKESALSEEEQRVLAAVERNKGNIRKTSQELGISRTRIYRYLERRGVRAEAFRSGTNGALKGATP